MGVDAFLSVFRERIHVRAQAYQVVVEKKGERTDEELVGSPVVHSERWEKRFGTKKGDGGG